MRSAYAPWLCLLVAVTMFLATELWPPAAQSACCYFSAKEQDILQPAQKAFITWDPRTKMETFTVQPRFEGNAADFGMVIPTPSRPELHEMPRDFFKELAVFTILKQRDFPQSKLLPPTGTFAGGLGALGGLGAFGGFGGGMAAAPPRRPAVKVVEAGVVGSLDYKILTAGRADDLYGWLKDHRYHYAGDEATLDFYVKKKWFFTVMKIDTLQMRKRDDGTFQGDVSPTRFKFTSEKLVYPLKITQLSVKDKTEALFYIQAPDKVDLPGDMTYQFQWLPMLQAAQGSYGKGIPGPPRLPGKGDSWVQVTRGLTPALIDQARELGFDFVSGQRPQPSGRGRTPTTLEWAKRLTAQDLQVMNGEAPYSEKVPDVDAGFTATDLEDQRKAAAATRVIRARLAKSKREKPGGYLVREAPAEDIRQLRILQGHLQEGQFLTKLRKTFTKEEMAEDLLILPARLKQFEDSSEYEEVLPTSPP